MPSEALYIVCRGQEGGGVRGRDAAESQKGGDDAGDFAEDVERGCTGLWREL